MLLNRRCGFRVPGAWVYTSFGALREEMGNKERLSAKIRMDRETKSIANDENSTRHDRAKISRPNRFRPTSEKKEIVKIKLFIDSG